MSEIASKHRHDNEEQEAYIREHGDIPSDEDYEMELRTYDRKRLWATATIEELHRMKEEHEKKVNPEAINERHKELKSYIPEHNQKLIEIFKDWYGERKTHVLIRQQQYAVEHLQTEYPITWKLWFEECKALKNQISEDEDKINEFEYGLEKIVQGFEEEHIELNGNCELCKNWHDELEPLK